MMIMTIIFRAFRSHVAAMLLFAWALLWALPGRARQSLEEHEAVMAAIRARDAIGAGARMRAHIESGAETLAGERERVARP